ncbi:unnamed protein product, partial [marine sediment metagenome]
MAGQIQGDPATATTTIARPLSSTANWLYENRCGFNAFITWACDGARAISSNFEIAAVVFGMKPTNVSILAPVVRSRGNDARIDTSVEVAYESIELVYHIAVNDITMENTADANAIAMLPEACASKCANARGLCEEGYIGLDGTLYDSEIKKTEDGVTWTQTAADPFAEGGDAGQPVIFPLYDGHRVVVPRISVSIWRPAEVA